MHTTRALTLLCLAACTLLPHRAPAQEPPADAAEPLIEKLGDERYRIGSIVVDKARNRFTVPATVLNVDATLEYVAVTRGGGKGYESLLELDSSAMEFQLACILVGLDDALSVKPRYQFDRREAKGQAVRISLSWGEGEEAKSVRAANALRSGEETFDDHRWVYIGSVMEGGELMAETLGTLIGFVHDPYAIIEHRVGAGVGEYGLITGNAALLPPEGSRIDLTVAVP